MLREREVRESERSWSASPTHVLKSVEESDWSGPIFLSSWWLWYHHHPHATTVILIVSCWSLVLVLSMRDVHNPKVNNGICSTVGLSLSLKGFQQCSCFMLIFSLAKLSRAASFCWKWGGKVERRMFNSWQLFACGHLPRRLNCGELSSEENSTNEFRKRKCL